MANTKNTSKVHPEILKMYNSPVYRKRVKRLTELVKNVYMIHKPLPRREILRKKNPSEEDLEKFHAANRYKLDKEVIHYFAQPLEVENSRSGFYDNDN